MGGESTPGSETGTGLRAAILTALTTTPAKHATDRARPWDTHGTEHQYDATCALCRGEADALTDAVMAVVQPAIDAAVFNARHYVRGQCRHCGGRPGLPDAMARSHWMRCPLYVGPLRHDVRGRSPMLIGEVNDCTCGRSWRDEEGGCPDATVDWRGPRSAEANQEA